MLHDFHTHTLASDGALVLPELVRRAEMSGYSTLAVTDHVGSGGIERLIAEAVIDRDLVSGSTSTRVLVGIELTHIPPAEIDALAKRAKAAGAEIVVVHGETIVEPVIAGTNAAALSSRFVDILSHPGLITPQEAGLAQANGVFLELSARKGHGLANGHVAKTAMAAGAELIVGSDAHGPGDLLTASSARRIALGAGLDEAAAHIVLLENPAKLLRRLG